MGIGIRTGIDGGSKREAGKGKKGFLRSFDWIWVI